MENLENAITDVIIIDDNIFITYDNGAIETLPKTVDTYKRMYEMWVKDEPVFISDKFKPMLNNLILINSNIKKINEFFVESNIENVKRFLIYMRGRKEYIAAEKIKWNKIKSDI